MLFEKSPQGIQRLEEIVDEQRDSKKVIIPLNDCVKIWTPSNSLIEVRKINHSTFTVLCIVPLGKTIRASTFFWWQMSKTFPLIVLSLSYSVYYFATSTSSSATMIFDFLLSSFLAIHVIISNDNAYIQLRWYRVYIRYFPVTHIDFRWCSWWNYILLSNYRLVWCHHVSFSHFL